MTRRGRVGIDDEVALPASANCLCSFLGTCAGRTLRHPDASPAEKFEQLSKIEKLPQTVYGDSYIGLRDSPRMTTWSFTQATHPAHPAVVCRRIVGPEGALRLEMNASCLASKSACDALIAEFELLNARIIDELKRRHPN